MRIGAAMALLAALVLTAISTAGCSRGQQFRVFEYEEEMFLSLDGSATVYVNTSIAALDALRGATFPTSPATRIDRDDVARWFTTAVTRVTRTPSLSRRNGRRFVHVRLDVDDVTKLSEAGPFAWSTYRFAKDGELFVYRQTVGDAAGRTVGEVGWTGEEGISFRIHMPSRIVYHNAGANNLKRGNILVWEQTLTDRLRNEPLTLDARIEVQSILSRTLLLFGATMLAVAAMFAAIVWLVSRRPPAV